MKPETVGIETACGFDFSLSLSYFPFPPIYLSIPFPPIIGSSNSF